MITPLCEQLFGERSPVVYSRGPETFDGKNSSQEVIWLTEKRFDQLTVSQMGHGAKKYINRNSSQSSGKSTFGHYSWSHEESA